MAERVLGVRRARAGSRHRLPAAGSRGKPGHAGCRPGGRTSTRCRAMGLPDGGAQATAADLVRALDGLTGRGRWRVPVPGDAGADDRAARDQRRQRGALRARGHPCRRGAAARIGHAGEDPGSAPAAGPIRRRASGSSSRTSPRAAAPFERLDELLAERADDGGALGCSGCAGSTCCSPTGRSTRTPCAPSSRRPSSSTCSRAAAGSGSSRSRWRMSRRAASRRSRFGTSRSQRPDLVRHAAGRASGS